MPIEVAYRSLFKHGEELCGDKVDIVHTPHSQILVLSDGLGSGVKANILATLTSKIISTMLKEGSTVEEAVETIVNTLPVCKVRQLAYSTFSILEIFNNGHAHLVEFDSPPCIFIRDGEVVEIPFVSRDISGKNVRESEFEVKEGDMFTLMSDGIIHAGVGALLNFGWQWENVSAFMRDTAKQGLSAQRAVASLMQMVDTLYMGKPGDDSTALVACVTCPKPVSLFTGPPVDKKDDDRIVQDFMAGPGKKVVCGGSSANIVARVLQREITTELNFSDPSVPPIGYIKGIDLVTEGVLTLNRTLEILRVCAAGSGGDPMSALQQLDANNGAAKLAKLFVEDCTDLHMFIGQAINPAHQNPDLPQDLSIKMRLIKEIRQVLQEMGKTVEIQYY